ncbi:transposase [Fusobacterium sp. THCT1E2]
MERKSRKNRRMSDGKKNIISALIEEYDMQDVLKDLLGETIQEMLESEMTEHLEYDAYGGSHNINSHNGKKNKIIKSKYGESLI